ASAVRIQLRLRLLRLATQCELLEQWHGKSSRRVARSVRVSYVHTDIPVVAIEFHSGIARSGGRFALLLSGRGLFDQRGQIFAVVFRLLDQRLRIEIVERGIRNLICKIESLLERQPNRT